MLRVPYAAVASLEDECEALRNKNEELREELEKYKKATEELIQYWRQNGKCVCCGGWWGGESAMRGFSEALGHPPVEDI
jgi:hypothetical protein